MEGTFLFYVTNLPGLAALGIVVLEKNFFLIHDVTSRNHVLKGLRVLMG